MDNYDEPGHVGIPYFQTIRTMVIFFATNDGLIKEKLCRKNQESMSGWWYTYPSEQYEFVSWDDSSKLNGKS